MCFSDSSMIKKMARM